MDGSTGLVWFSKSSRCSAQRERMSFLCLFRLVPSLFVQGAWNGISDRKQPLLPHNTDAPSVNHLLSVNHSLLSVSHLLRWWYIVFACAILNFGILHLWLYFRPVNCELARNFLVDPSWRQVGHPWCMKSHEVHASCLVLFFVKSKHVAIASWIEFNCIKAKWFYLGEFINARTLKLNLSTRCFVKHSLTGS